MSLFLWGKEKWNIWKNIGMAASPAVERSSYGGAFAECGFLLCSVRVQRWIALGFGDNHQSVSFLNSNQLIYRHKEAKYQLMNSKPLETILNVH